MGALASQAQQADVGRAASRCSPQGDELVFGAGDGFAPLGEGVAEGAFFAPTLLLCRDAHEERRRARRRGLRPGAAR